jgi:Holliday junction resolvase RusA-like endonuclease
LARYAITPVAKPRMTQRDSWAKRPCVLRYRSYKDCVRAAGIVLPDQVVLIFHLSMPASWSQKKRAKMAGTPHQQKPDVDNLVKGILDAACEEDSRIWNVWAVKRWAAADALEVRPLAMEPYAEPGPTVAG